MADQQYTRRIATIISIDAVGFSRMMGFDELATILAFESRRSVIEKCCEVYGGRVFGVAGDSIMVVFDRPLEAVRAAFNFQYKIRSLNARTSKNSSMAFRVGINTGNVIVRGAVLYGDTVNIAARLQEYAPCEGVVISYTTWRHVIEEAVIYCHDLGELAMKNINQPVHAYHIFERQQRLCCFKARKNENQINLHNRQRRLQQPIHAIL